MSVVPYTTGTSKAFDKHKKICEIAKAGRFKIIEEKKPDDEEEVAASPTGTCHDPRWEAAFPYEVVFC